MYADGTAKVRQAGRADFIFWYYRAVPVLLVRIRIPQREDTDSRVHFQHIV
jgi:hypothetical protein